MTTRSGYTFHIRNHLAELFPYVEQVARERRVRVSRVISQALEYVLRERMLDDIMDGRIRGQEDEFYEPLRSSRVAVPAPTVNLSPTDVRDEDLLPVPRPRTNLPAAKRRVPVPVHNLRPDFHQHRPVASNGFTRQREKTKAELREELRQAVENTR